MKAYFPTHTSFALNWFGAELTNATCQLHLLLVELEVQDLSRLLQGACDTGTLEPTSASPLPG